MTATRMRKFWSCLASCQIQCFWLFCIFYTSGNNYKVPFVHICELHKLTWTFHGEKMYGWIIFILVHINFNIYCIIKIKSCIWRLMLTKMNKYCNKCIAFLITGTLLKCYHTYIFFVSPLIYFWDSIFKVSKQSFSGLSKKYMISKFIINHWQI